MSESLHDSRRRIRSYLQLDTNQPQDASFDDDHFPRSKVMRFAINPRNRQLLMLAGSVLTVLATRAVGSGRLGVVADIARSFSRFNKNT